ncbi:MAG: tetratricopeptide repeat protein [Rikenellaceae bacterium]|jgi:tetratricopeptide (TPR) repeat protein|nr:tetratricopeptide repeat protein [Bacteroidales bacterium]
MKVRNSLFLILVMFITAGNALFAQYDKEKFLDRGRNLLSEGKFAQAIENFNVLTRLDSNLYESYFLRGIAKYNLGDFLGAQLDFDKTIKLNPIYTPAYHYRAITLSRTGKYDLALKDLEEAVELRPSYIGLYFSRGVTYFLSQQFDKAVEDFSKFLVYEPKVADAYLNRGAAYLFLGDTLKALNDYNIAINLNKFDPEGYIRRSRIYMMQNKLPEAISDLNSAISLDSTNTFAYFNRALAKYDNKDIMGALADLDTVLMHDKNNALALYNRALIKSEIGDYNNALEDYDRVLQINPDNVLAYYNRAFVYTQLGRYSEAVDDYSSAIKLYPDFANAYLNRSYVKNQIGQYKSAKKDYEIAQSKIKAYRSMASDSVKISAFADTTQKYNKLLALDADFAKKEFDNNLLQYRDVDITLKPLYKFMATKEREEYAVVLKRGYEDSYLNDFVSKIPIPVQISSAPAELSGEQQQIYMETIDNLIRENRNGYVLFAKALLESNMKKFNLALDFYNQAIATEPEQTFFYINRGALQAEMIDFISSIESNVQVLTLDDAGATRAKVQGKSSGNYDYSAAIQDMKKAASLAPNFPYIYYNLGNLYCLSNNLPESINNYTKALEIYPYIAEAYYNRGLVLIYLKDREKGCYDLSKAGELGLREAYAVIKKYCSEE